jgi:hypothetical protein
MTISFCMQKNNLKKLSCKTDIMMLYYLTVRSTTDTLDTGTRKAMPVSFPVRAGMTLPTALAAPVEAGIMFWCAPRPSRHSYKHKKINCAEHAWNYSMMVSMVTWNSNIFHKGYDVTLFFSNIIFLLQYRGYYESACKETYLH